MRAGRGVRAAIRGARHLEITKVRKLDKHTSAGDLAGSTSFAFSWQRSRNLLDVCRTGGLLRECLDPLARTVELSRTCWRLAGGVRAPAAGSKSFTPNSDEPGAARRLAERSLEAVRARSPKNASPRSGATTSSCAIRGLRITTDGACRESPLPKSADSRRAGGHLGERRRVFPDGRVGSRREMARRFLPARWIAPEGICQMTAVSSTPPQRRSGVSTRNRWGQRPDRHNGP